MTISERLPAIFVVTVLVAGVSVIVWDILQTPNQANALSVTVPALSTYAEAGRQAFDTNCAACHGKNGVGTDKGPPLVHDIYNPGHHGDSAFFLAAKRGVRQHHWRFGNMPPLPQVSDTELQAIVRYIRELQVANGITYKPHRM